MVYKKLTTDQITQVEAQAGKEATKLLDECLLAKDSVLFDADSGDASSVANIVDGVDGFPMALKINILPAQAGSGTPAPDNVRKLSGWEGVKLYHSGNDTSAPTEHDIAFPPAAGTVYGGTLEIAKDGSGTLTVDTTYIELNGDYSWGGANNTGYNGEVGTNRYIEFASNNLPVPLLVDSDLGQNGKAIRACDRLRVQLSSIWANDTNNDVINFNAQSQVHLRLANATIGVESTADGATRTAAFKAWLTANPVHVAYQIAAPQTYTLTAEQIKSLFGVNNVWVDCGNTQITEYKADIKLYLDAKIAELQALILENT